MKTNSPHQYLDGVSPKERGNQNRLKIVEWLYRWGYSSSSILQQLLKKQATGYAAAAVKSGYLIQIKTDSGSPKYIYTLSESGLQLATRNSMQLLRYYEIERHQVKQSEIRHRLLAQEITLCGLQNKTIDEYLTKRMPDDYDVAKERPHDIVFIKGENRVGVEVVLSVKSKRKLDQFLLGIDSALEIGTYKAFIIYSESQALLEHYKAALNKPMRVWVKDDRGRWKAEKTMLFSESNKHLVKFFRADS